MAEIPSIGSSGEAGKWAEVTDVYEGSDGTYMGLRATATGESFAVPTETGFPSLDNLHPEQPDAQ